MERLGHYRVVAPLGAGGMGEVYRAIDERLGRTVAIKLLHAADATSAQMQLRLLREAQAASALDHPGVVTVFDVGMHESRAYVVMEHVTGDRFSDLVGKVEPLEALRLCADAADALAAAHDAGILHRDVKSDNLMRTRDGRVKVLDFGLAKLQDGGAAAMATSHSGAGHAHAVSADASLDETMRPEDDPTISQDIAATLPATSATPGPDLTQAGQLIGTPLYMSPEQAEREPVTARSEVYALGVVLYELLTGTVPFRGDDVPGTLEAIRTATLVPPSQRRPSLPKVLDPLVVRALARRPADRFDDMAPFAIAMRKVSVELGGGGPARWPWIALGAGVLGAGVAAAFVLTRDENDPPASAATVEVDAAPEPPRLVLQGEPRRLTARDGCEEFPSFADGGRTVIFDGARGKDYVIQAIEIASGELRQLTEINGWDYASSLSPDGKQLAFVRSDATGVAVFVMGYDPPSPPRKVIDGGTKPAWTADGKLIAGPARRISVIDAATGAVFRELSSPDGRRFNKLVELEDGRFAAVVSESSAQTSLGVAFLDAAGASTMMFEAPIDEVLTPVRGGVLVARQRREASDLWYVPLHGTPQAVEDAELEPRKGLVFSPTGDLVWSTCRTAFEVASLGVASDGKPELVKVSGGTWTDHMPAGVPGTRSILLTSDRGGPAGSLWIIDRDGVAEPREVPVGDLTPTDPSVSADRAWVSFSSPGAGIYVVPFDGSAAPRQLTTGGADVVPVFHRDEVFYQGEANGHAAVLAVPIAGGTPRVEVEGALIPDVSRDGRWIVYRDLATDEPRLRDRTTGKSRPLSRALAPGPYDYLRFSPDASRVAISLASNMILEVDVKTGKLLRSHDTGGDQLTGITYVADELIITRAIWQGDLWLAHGELVLPE